MTTITLDRSKTFAECRGERTPTDPQYKVAFWQGQKIGKDIILLPFDSNGVLVPDDGKKDAWQGVDNDNKPVTFHPLYNQAMRDLRDRKLARLNAGAAGATPAADPIVDADGDVVDEVNPVDDVNIGAWLRGEAQYEWSLLQKAAKARYSRNFSHKKQMVEDLVLDEKVIPEDQLSAELKKYLPPKAA